LGLEVAALASSGDEAVRLASEQHIEIVITDIQMPGLDGMALCRRLREINENTQIIIISGYADFEYAREAICQQVIGYCLKPLNANELIRYLKTAMRKIQKETIRNGDFLLDNIESESYKIVEEMLRELGGVSPPYYIAVSVGVSDISNVLRSDYELKLGRHKYLYFSAVDFYRGGVKALIACAKENCGVGFWPRAVGLSDLRSAVTNAEVMAHQFFISETPTIQEETPDQTKTDIVFQLLEKSMDRPENLQSFLAELEQSKDIYDFNIRAAYQLYNRVFSGNMIVKAEEMRMFGYERLVGEYGSFREMLRKLRSALEESPPAKSHWNTQASTTFLKIIKYINENFSQEISLQKLSDLFHLNATYISQLIKSETGLNYSQYLTELRIGKAKRLLETTDLSLNDISESVGFNDYFYFIKKFKKAVGITPGRYSQNPISGGSPGKY
ncbi:MAG: response regulator, partial [Clostridiales bacterium]|jgi:two-component system response regulator YesN|nr:response regulator [Clostridiales bacterium]